MSGRTILILTGSHLCRNPRVMKEAVTLGRAGFDVTVLSLAVRRDFDALDRELTAGQPFRHVRVDFTNEGFGTRASFFGERALTRAARAMGRHLGWEFSQSLGPARSLRRAALAQPADLTILHTEMPLWSAEGLAAAGRRVALDLEDWHSEDLLPEDRLNRPLGLLRQAEDFALAHAAYSSTTSASMAAALAEVFHCEAPVVIRNTFPLQAVSRVDRQPADHLPTFVWFSQTVGQGRGLEAFLAAWALTKTPSRVCLIGDVSGHYR